MEKPLQLEDTARAADDSDPPRPHGDPMREHVPATGPGDADDASLPASPEPRELPPSRPHGDPLREESPARDGYPA